MLGTPHAADVTTLLVAWRGGDTAALDRLIPLVYTELRRVAHRYMRDERPNHPLQTTALVHEAYLRLVDVSRVDWESRNHFLAVSAQMMRRILVDAARRRNAGKRGGDASHVALDEASLDGIVRVGRLDGGEPHILAGHKGAVSYVAISPDLRWVATTGEDNTLRLWPMPDLGAPPLHALPLDQLLAKIRSLTNLRAVRDPVAATGWRIEIGAFPGWRSLPVW